MEQKHKYLTIGICVGFTVSILISLWFTIGLHKTHAKEKKRIATVCEEQIVGLQERITDLTKEQNKSVVHIIKRLRPQLDDEIVNLIDSSIIKYSYEYRLPPEFVVYLMDRESRFSPLAKSSAGAMGLMQIMPSAHKDKLEKMGITVQQIYHIDNNVKLGCWILREYMNTTGSIEKALTRYVGGTHDGYVKDILIGFTNEMVPKKEIIK